MDVDPDMISPGGLQDDQSPEQLQHLTWARDWGALLRTARQIAGMSLTQLSDCSGLSKGYLSKLESSAPGAANPSRSTLAALAQALPSFRPLAHTLAPGLGADQLDYAGVFATQCAAQLDPHLADGQQLEPLDASRQPIQFGWRELEVLAALLTLERAALPCRISAAMLARATGRPVALLRPVLRQLADQLLVIATQPAVPGRSPTFRLAPDVATICGVARLGDLLILAATLVAGAMPTHDSHHLDTHFGSHAKVTQRKHFSASLPDHEPGSINQW